MLTFQNSHRGLDLECGELRPIVAGDYLLRKHPFRLSPSIKTQEYRQFVDYMRQIYDGDIVGDLRAILRQPSRFLLIFAGPNPGGISDLVRILFDLLRLFNGHDFAKIVEFVEGTDPKSRLGSQFLTIYTDLRPANIEKKQTFRDTFAGKVILIIPIRNADNRCAFYRKEAGYLANLLAFPPH